MRTNDAISVWSGLIDAVARLRAGEPVAIPTETVYGLAARIDSKNAIEQVFRLKERPFFDPLIVHVSDLESVQRVAAAVPRSTMILMKAFWPGPLTVVLPRRDDLNPTICAGLPSVGVRLPAHPLARRVIRRVGVPLAAPSANKFTATSPTTAAHVRKTWPGHEVFVLDGGPCNVGIESTVLQTEESEGSVLVDILRPGAVSIEDIRRVLAPHFSSVDARRSLNVIAPGQMEEHYRPAVPLIIVDAKKLPLNAEALEEISASLGRATNPYLELTLSDEAVLAARELYAGMHRLAESKPAFLVVRREEKHDEPQWAAVWDRITRAASLEIR